MSRGSQKIRPPPLVLVVESDLDTREMYAEWLIYSGYRVAEATRADDAMEKARTLRPDIITADMGLQGGKDGCRFCEDLKAFARTKNIPVIAVTAWAVGGHLERARKAGCDSVFVKPCLPETLLVEIQRLLKLPLTPHKG
jgi:two-component system cell cycle response regulator DivK